MNDVIRVAIENIQETISNVIDLFYQKREQEAYQKIDTLILELMEVNDLLIEALHQGENLLFDEEKFKGVLLEAMEAMEQKDMILFADILQYELSEQLQQCIKERK